MRPKTLPALVTAAALAAPCAAWSQAAPSGPHPRIWLDAGTLAAMRAQRGMASSGTARAVSRCDDARANPDEYRQASYQGDTWAFAASACALAYQVTGDAAYATAGLLYLNGLLDDYTTLGDGAGGDEVVRHDTGYATRFFGPYSALAYDWLHDAPGMTETLRAHARARFDAWMSWYDTMGYLRDEPGSNYEAGYVFAATLIAIAEGGEAGATGDALWRTVVDQRFGTDLAMGLAPGGVLNGGDWAEGWQYAPLSVMEYALAARALEEQGVAEPGMDRYATELITRHIYAQTPGAHGVYVGGDFEDDAHYAAPEARTLIATIAGNTTPAAQAWARAELAARSLADTDAPVFQALADARTGPSTPFPADAPTGWVATGTRTVYARASWDATAAWAVFQSAPRLVDDHQHFDAGEWVLSRGADDLVVDPSPYGSLSTLTGNAPAVDSAVLPMGYSPSQGPWGQTTSLVWTRFSSTGLVAARGEYSDQFRFRDTASDVPVALRDWVFVPAGADSTVVLIDRVQTGDAARGLHLRARTATHLALSGDAARGTAGGSAVVFQRVWSSSGSAAVRAAPVGDDCSSAPRGQCELARFAGDEFRLDVSGPNAGAIELIDATAADAPSPAATALAGAGYRGVVLDRAGRRVAVVITDAPNAMPGASLTYRVPAGTSALHVVPDAPTGTGGRSDVSGTMDGADCAITVTPHDGASGGYDGRPLVVSVSASCAVNEDGTAPTGVDAGTPDGSVSHPTGPGDGGTEPGMGSHGGCGCSTHGRADGRSAAVALAAVGLLLVRARRRRR